MNIIKESPETLHDKVKQHKQMLQREMEAVHDKELGGDLCQLNREIVTLAHFKPRKKNLDCFSIFFKLAAQMRRVCSWRIESRELPP